MGLNEVYANARSQILMMTHLPSVGKAYALIMADEGQRMTASLNVVSNTSEHLALFAGKGQFPKRFQPRKKNWDQFCEFCKLQGHVKKDCYKLNGYPPDWKFKKKQPGTSAGSMQNNRNQNAVNQVTDARSDMDLVDAFAPIATGMKGKTTKSGSLMTAQPTFTPTQYNRILHLLEREAAGSSLSNAPENMANMAGPLQWSSEGDW